MRREHPLRILRYCLKNLWLLIFPLLRGAYHFASREDVEAWLRVTWMDLLILLVIFGYGFLNWYFRQYGFAHDQLCVQEGILFRRKRYLPVRNISSVTIERPAWLRPFRGSYLHADTPSGLLETPDIKLLIRYRDEHLFLSALPRLRQGKRHHFSDKVGLMRTILFSVVFSSSFSGALYTATFWFQSGRIARDIIEEFRLTERLNDASEEVANRLLGIPPAAVTVGFLILFTWLLSFVANLCRYGGFSMESDKRMSAVRCGLITRRHHLLVNRKINFIELRQNLFTMLFRVYSLAVNCPGFGTQRGSLPVCLPLLKQKELEEALPMIFPGSRLQKNRLRAPWHSFGSYLTPPVLAAVAVIPAAVITKPLFPQFDDAIGFFQIMLEIPIAWKFIAQITAQATTGLSISKGHVCVRYCSWFSFRTIIADTDRIVKVRIRQFFWQKWSGKCTVILYFRAEVARKCCLRGMLLKDVQEHLKEFL